MVTSEETQIFYHRLVLISMTPAFLEACLAGDSAASRMIGLEVPSSRLRERELMRLRLDQLAR